MVVSERLRNCCNLNSNFRKVSIQVIPASSILVGRETAKGLVSVLQKKTVDKKWSNTVAQMSTRHAFVRHEVTSDGTTSWHLIAAKNLPSVYRDDRNTPLNVLPWNASWLTSTPIAWLTNLSGSMAPCLFQVPMHHKTIYDCISHDQHKEFFRPGRSLCYVHN